MPICLSVYSRGAGLHASESIASQLPCSLSPILSASAGFVRYMNSWMTWRIKASIICANTQIRHATLNKQLSPRCNPTMHNDYTLTNTNDIAGTPMKPDILSDSAEASSTEQTWSGRVVSERYSGCIKQGSTCSLQKLKRADRRTGKPPRLTPERCQ